MAPALKDEELLKKIVARLCSEIPELNIDDDDRKDAMGFVKAVLIVLEETMRKAFENAEARKK